MLVAHLVRLGGDLSGPRVEEAAALIGAEVRAPHQPCCAAVEVDLSDVVRLSGTLVVRLRALRQEGLGLGVVLSLTAPRGTPAHRVLEFHRGLGEALPAVRTDLLGDT